MPNSLEHAFVPLCTIWLGSLIGKAPGVHREDPGSNPGPPTGPLGGDCTPSKVVRLASAVKGEGSPDLITARWTTDRHGAHHWLCYPRDTRSSQVGSEGTLPVGQG